MAVRIETTLTFNENIANEQYSSEPTVMIALKLQQFLSLVVKKALSYL